MWIHGERIQQHGSCFCHQRPFVSVYPVNPVIHESVEEESSRARLCFAVHISAANLWFQIHFQDLKSMQEATVTCQDSRSRCRKVFRAFVSAPLLECFNANKSVISSGTASSRARCGGGYLSRATGSRAIAEGRHSSLVGGLVRALLLQSRASDGGWRRG